MKESKLSFRIKPYSIEDKILQVEFKMDNSQPENTLQLYKGNIKLFDISCSAPLYEKGKFIYIECKGKQTLTISYKVKIGYGGKHGLAGGMYGDLLVFSGEQALILPAETLSIDDGKVKEATSSITLTYDIPKEWNCIVPFSKNMDDEEVIISYCDSPSWCDIYELLKSSYAFGNLKRIQCSKKGKVLSIYIDASMFGLYDEITISGINSIYDYYRELFEYNMDLSLVFLRTDQEDNSYIMGGCGRHIIASTFMPENKRDWQLMSHRMFHAFMDSRITVPGFHIPPNVWLTEGLATYYENLSLGSLSEDARNRLEIDLSKELVSIFKRYVYMRLKDPGLLSIIPMEEGELKILAQIEFLHYTQAPLIIELIEDYNSARIGRSDVLIKYLISRCSKEDFSMEKIFKYALGNNADAFAMQFLFGTQVLPLWYAADGAPEDEEAVIKQLNDFEYLLWTWFASEDSTYPLDKLSYEYISEFSNVAEEKGIHFAATAMEENVKQLSLTVYKLLKQYALRAQVCKVYFNDPKLRYKLLGDKENIEKWKHFIEMHYICKKLF